jgi:Leucine rich repeat
LGSRRSKANAKSFITNQTQTVEDGPRVSRLTEVLDFIGHEQEWSDPVTLDGRSTDSFQYLAARWIADLDHRYVAMEDSEEFRTRYVLALFYYAMHGDRWEHEVNWLTMHSYCSWNNDYPSVSARQPIRIGVECDPTKGNYTVTKLFLPSLDLQGELPTELGWLVNLETLDLYANDINGNIPVELQSLENLKTLILHNNHMGGTLPTWIDEWTSLETLDLSRNKFTGALPTAFARLSNLKNLNIEYNQITGTLEALAERDSLRYLALGDNKLKGNLTEEMIAAWFLMTDLDLSDNNIVGTLPSNLFMAQSLETIDLHGNKFNGTIPNVADDNTRLKFLALVSFEAPFFFDSLAHILSCSSKIGFLGQLTANSRSFDIWNISIYPETN